VLHSIKCVAYVLCVGCAVVGNGRARIRCLLCVGCLCACRMRLWV